MNDWRQTVESASRGDASALEALLEAHLPRLRAFVHLRMQRSLRGKESASDLVQSACREVLEHIDRYQFRSEANFRHWLFTTALRKVQNRVAYYRAERRDVEREVEAGSGGALGELDAVCADFDTPSAVLSRRESLDRLEAAFDRLSDEHREVITLARIVGLPHKEVADAMGRSEAASRMLLYRALAELGSALEERDP